MGQIEGNKKESDMDFEEIDDTEYDLRGLEVPKKEVQLVFPWGTKEEPDVTGS